jgi:hypothetical protein
MLFEINQLNLIGIPVNIDLLSFGNKGNNKITDLRTIFQSGHLHNNIEDFSS